MLINHIGYLFTHVVYKVNVGSYLNVHYNKYNYTKDKSHLIDLIFHLSRR